MTIIYGSPRKYIQGRGELTQLGRYSGELGNRALVIVSPTGYDNIKATIESSLAQAGITALFEFFKSECSNRQIERLVELATTNQSDLVIGIGSGKVFDVAKAVAYYRNIPVVIVPTIATTDAPCSALSVIYSDDGVFERYLPLRNNPDLVLVDSQAISSTPVRLTVAGIGDGISTYFEARACQKSGALNSFQAKPSLAARGLAQLGYETLLEQGIQARRDLEAGKCTEAVEAVIEANTLLSGIGFESGGLAGAHGIANGLSVIPACNQALHGEKVAFGTICQLVLEDAPDEEVNELIDFCYEIKLPISLEQLGMTIVNQDNVEAIAKLATAPDSSIHNLPFPVSASQVTAAIFKADLLGRLRLGPRG